jgi:hypothetical protein
MYDYQTFAINVVLLYFILPLYIKSLRLCITSLDVDPNSWWYLVYLGLAYTIIFVLYTDWVVVYKQLIGN